MTDDIEVDFNASDNEVSVFRQIKDDTPSNSLNNSSIMNAIKSVTKKKNSYFIISYPKGKSEEIKNMIDDKLLLLNRITYNEMEYISVLADSKSVYFMFLDFDKRLINAIMKKDYITPEKNLKLESKSKSEIYFTELIKNYRMSENDLKTLLPSDSNDKIRMVITANLV
jgi:hypothetical protein